MGIEQKAVGAAVCNICKTEFNSLTEAAQCYIGCAITEQSVAITEQTMALKEQNKILERIADAVEDLVDK